MHAARTEVALHAAVRLGLGWDTLEGHLVDLGERGRPGIQVMRRLLEVHRARPPLGSGLEARFLWILREAGLPEPRRQVDLGSDRWAGRVDFLYDDARLVIEVNGDWHHTGRLAEQLVRTAPDRMLALVREARRR